MHISLRTIFVIVTTVAVYLAVHVVTLQGAGPAMPTRSMYAAMLLPLVVIWVTAAAWVFQHRRTLVGAHLVLWALGLNIVGRLANEVLQSWAYRMFDTSANNLGGMLFTLSSLISVAVMTASWSLILLAFARANRSARQSSHDSERHEQPPATSPWLE